MRFEVYRGLLSSARHQGVNVYIYVVYVSRCKRDTRHIHSAATSRRVDGINLCAWHQRMNLYTTFRGTSRRVDGINACVWHQRMDVYTTFRWAHALNGVGVQAASMVCLCLTIGVGLLKGPMGRRFRMSEVPLSLCCPVAGHLSPSEHPPRACPTPRPLVVNLSTCKCSPSTCVRVYGINKSMYMWLVFFPQLELQWRSHQHRPGPGVDPADKCRATMAHIRQSNPDSGLGSQVKVLKPFYVFPTSLGSGQGQPFSERNKAFHCFMVRGFGYRGHSKSRTHTALGSYGRSMPRSVGPS